MRKSHFFQARFLIPLLFISSAVIGLMNWQGRVGPVAQAAPAITCPIKIMAAGDSITYGRGSNTGPGYRFTLNYRASLDSLNILWVGTVATPAPKHEGHPGITIRQLHFDYLYPAINSEKPDVVIILIGTNDVDDNYNPEEMRTYLNIMLNRLLSDYPNLKIILASIPPINTAVRVPPDPLSNLKDQVASEYSDYVSNLASIKPADRVKYAEVYDILDKNTDLKAMDGLHPNDSGYTKIGNSIYPHVKAWAQQFCPQTATPTSTPTPIGTPTPTPTPTFTPTSTPTPTPTFTPTPTATPTPVWRFRGNTYNGANGDISSPLANVVLNLYGYNEGGQSPGVLVQTRNSDAGGFYNFYVVQPHIYDYFVLKPDTPSGMAVSDITTNDGVVILPDRVQWYQATAAVHLADFYFNAATPTPTQTPSPTETPTQPIVLTSTVTSTPTFTTTPTLTPTLEPGSTETPTPTITSTLTNTASATPTIEPSVTTTPTPDASSTATSTPTSTIIIKSRIFLPLFIKG